MKISHIPTPETDAAWKDPQRTRDGTGFRSDVQSIDIALSVAEKSKDLERRLTVAREALKRCDPGEHDYPIPSDPYDGAAFCEISVGDIRAIREALTLTAPKP